MTFSSPLQNIKYPLKLIILTLCKQSIVFIILFTFCDAFSLVKQ